MNNSLDNNTVENYPESTKSAFKLWVLEHDNSTLFNVLYIGLAVVLSVWLGLFWLVLVIGIHALIELYRQYLIHSKSGLAIAEMFWELKLDFALIIFAFWLAVYLDFIFGIAGLAAGARVAAQAGSRVAQTGTRFAIWQRIIRGFFLSIDDAGLALRAIATQKKKMPAYDDDIGEQTPYPITRERSAWMGYYKKGDWFAIIFGGFFLVLILFSPVIIGKDIQEVVSIIMQELRPLG